MNPPYPPREPGSSLVSPCAGVVLLDPRLYTVARFRRPGLPARHRHASMSLVATPLSTVASPATATSSTTSRESHRVVDLTVVIPAADEGPNLTLLMPQIGTVLDSLQIDYEILVVLPAGDAEAAQHGWIPGVRVLRQERRGYGGALLRGFSEAKGRYILTMDADLSHPPTFIRTLWEARVSAEVVIASRYVTGALRRCRGRGACSAAF
jgi:cellulose synthase/poly-beta-1,6-N-acetylglucosamine synthase-like glycosyltransferase